MKKNGSNNDNHAEIVAYGANTAIYTIYSVAFVRFPHFRHPLGFIINR